MGTNQEAKLTKFLKELSTLHGAMALGLTAVTAILTTQFKEYAVSYTDNGDVFLYIIPLLAIGGIVIGKMLYDRNVNSIPENASLDDKLVSYRSAFIQKCALIEGPGLISVIIGMQTENLLYMIIAGLLVIYFVLQRPTREKIIDTLNLNRSMLQ